MTAERVPGHTILFISDDLEDINLWSRTGGAYVVDDLMSDSYQAISHCFDCKSVARSSLVRAAKYVLSLAGP